MPKVSAQRLKRFARNKQGNCLVKKDVDDTSLVTWQCKHGHVFKASPHKILAGERWCGVCDAKERKQAQQESSDEIFKEVCKIARQKGGKCLSKEFKGLSVKLKWECKQGHKWKAIPANMLYRDTWCPRCARELVAEKRRAFNAKGEKRVVKMYEKEKKPVQDISLETGVNENTIYQILRKHDVVMRPNGPQPKVNDTVSKKIGEFYFDKNKSGLWIASHLNIGYRTVYRHIDIERKKRRKRSRVKKRKRRMAMA